MIRSLKLKVTLVVIILVLFVLKRSGWISLLVILNFKIRVLRYSLGLGVCKILVLLVYQNILVLKLIFQVLTNAFQDVNCCAVSHFLCLDWIWAKEFVNLLLGTGQGWLDLLRMESLRRLPGLLQVFTFSLDVLFLNYLLIAQKVRQVIVNGLLVLLLYISRTQSRGAFSQVMWLFVISWFWSRVRSLLVRVNSDPSLIFVELWLLILFGSQLFQFLVSQIALTVWLLYFGLPFLYVIFWDCVDILYSRLILHLSVMDLLPIVRPGWYQTRLRGICACSIATIWAYNVIKI